MSLHDSAIVERYTQLAYTAAASQKWRKASCFALLAAAHLESIEKRASQLQYDYCIMAAEFTAKELTAPTSPPKPFEANVSLASFEAMRRENFKELFAACSSAQVAFCALQFAYTIWHDMPYTAFTVSESKSLLNRIMQLLVDCRMAEKAEYYANVWYRRAWNNRSYGFVIAIADMVIKVFLDAGEYYCAAEHLFKCIGDAQYHKSFSQHLEVLTSAFQTTSHRWLLAILSMIIPETHSVFARQYLAGALNDSCVATLSHQDIACVAKLCKHHPDNTCMAIQDTSSTDAYLAIKLIRLWDALLVKLDRGEVTAILQSFLSKEEMLPIENCHQCPSTRDCDKIVIYNAKTIPVLVEALFARPTATLVQWLAELGVLVPTLLLPPVSVVAATYPIIQPGFENHAECPSCPKCLPVDAATTMTLPTLASGSDKPPHFHDASSSNMSSTEKEAPLASINAGSIAPPNTAVVNAVPYRGARSIALIVSGGSSAPKIIHPSTTLTAPMTFIIPLEFNSDTDVSDDTSG